MQSTLNPEKIAQSPLVHRKITHLRVIMCAHTISVNGGKADEKVIVLCVQYR